MGSFSSLYGDGAPLDIWSMAAMLRDSTVAAIILHTRPQEIPLAMITWESIHGFPLFSYMGMGLRLAALRRSSAINNFF